jgi:hypothetical protein
MDVIDLVEQSAALALERASALQVRLRTASGAGTTVCEHEMHQLVTDIVSMRNAAELLKRQVARPPRHDRRQGPRDDVHPHQVA